MDFNCLIYHCLRRPDLRPYPGSAGRLEWEQEFLQSIVTYTKKVVGQVRPSKGVYIAIDGVVPMAKMRQQRMRRFKSAWLTEKGLAEGQEAGKERWDSHSGSKIPSEPTTPRVKREVWDTNAITPGTEFMRSLRFALEKEVGKHKGWRLSSSDEPGEGEHKVMELLRSVCGTHTHNAVYGLDADLIVLSLLTQDTLKEKGIETRIHLFREEVENGSLVRDAMGEEEFQWLSIDTLRDILLEPTGSNIRDYCCAMSFLGNDFLPSSLGLKMREDGHDTLIDLLNAIHAKGLRLVDSKNEIDPTGLLELLRILDAQEEKAIESSLNRKAQQGRPYASVELSIGDPNWALKQQAEACLMDGKHLRSDWRSVYKTKCLQDGIDTDRVYVEGLHWIWNYYRGLPVCYNWHYPWNLPPLWNAVTAVAATAIATNPTPLIKASDILPVEQLSLVLPPASWHLIPSAKHQTLIAKAPYLFPKEFGFCSLGKRWFWECEAKIPIPTILEVKTLLG
jgi:5'-3' exonuclease